MGELASSMPTSGGLYFWSFQLSPPPVNRLLCFVVGYSNTLGMLAALASVDWGAAVMISACISIAKDGSWKATDGQLYGIYILILISNAMICSIATKAMARVQSAFIISNLAMIIAIFIIFPASGRNRNSAHYVFGHIDNLSTWSSGFNFCLAWLTPVWTIASFDSCVHISEEATNAANAVPWAIFLATSVSGILGFLINIVIAFYMNPNVEALVNSDFGQPLAQIIFDALGKRGVLIIFAFLFLIQYSMGASVLIGSSRQMWAFSRDGALPFSEFLKKINRATGTPVITTWASVSCASALGLLCLIGPSAQGALFSLSIVGLYPAYLIPMVCRLLWPKSFAPGPFHLGIFSKPIHAVAVSFMLFICVIFEFPSSGPNPNAEDANYGIIILGAVFGGSLLYWWFPTFGAKHWFTGPRITLDAKEVDYYRSEVIAQDQKNLNVAAHGLML
ncbi:GABA-specific permease [Neolecta irregularis DAH-3]|uniref:GABA-specific permease n=1 Tax=Neolecta irregularis (strain DAH-3) TaxID=1198029 RepID=A0A1U7LVY1_NEOID|nr:GABA-specific permease [Neolecta irregularis DAH-3]|eukprot:OLL26794.1 GABA-specific permease [Neolecta irregularis DAH-3]